MKSPIPSLASSQPPALTDDATLAAALDCLRANVSLDLHGPCTLRTLFQVLSTCKLFGDERFGTVWERSRYFRKPRKSAAQVFGAPL